MQFLKLNICEYFIRGIHEKINLRSRIVILFILNSHFKKLLIVLVDNFSTNKFKACYLHAKDGHV